jgi:hypothetical protein
MPLARSVALTIRHSGFFEQARLGLILDAIDVGIASGTVIR